jgi:hypothetical protein
VPGGDLSVLEAVLETDRERIALLAEQEELLAEEEDAAGGGAQGADTRTAREKEEDRKDEADRQARLGEVSTGGG